MDLFMMVERRLGSRVDKRWWEQDGLELDGMWVEAWDAERTEGEEEMERTDMD